MSYTILCFSLPLATLPFFMMPRAVEKMVGFNLHKSSSITKITIQKLKTFMSNTETKSITTSHVSEITPDLTFIVTVLVFLC